MKRILGTALAAVLAAGAGLVAPAAAGAVPSNVVTSAEFNKVAYGNSLDHVRQVFGSKGTVIDREDPPGYGGDYVKVDFPTYYPNGTVEVEFLRRSSGAWYLVTKYAFWANAAARTADTATLPEFNRVAQGNSIAYVRSTFGTNGTITEYYDAPGNGDDAVVVEWPTEWVDGWVQVSFVKSSSGTWTVDTRSGSWAVDPAQTADKATEAEFDRVKAGNSIDYARSTFGTAGTIGSYYDAPGTVDDAVSIAWPTESPDGLVRLDFVKSSSGAWKVESRWARWGRPATPTADVATQAEFESLAAGDTLAHVRSTFGTAGTVTSRWDGPDVHGDWLEIAWYTGADTEPVFITFMVGSAETWAIPGVDYMWGPWPVGEQRAKASSQGQEPPAAGAPPGADGPVRPSWDLRDAG